MRFTDQTGFTIELPEVPTRIISLVPSQSELIWDLGKSDALVGITKFCIHPGKMHKTIERVGGTKQLDLNKIRQLKPDLIIGNKEENDQSQIEELRKEFTVWISDINDFKDALKMIEEVGEIIGKSKESIIMSGKIRDEFNKINCEVFARKRVAYLMWYNPIMAAAADTFINSILLQIGCKNVFSDRIRYPIIKFTDLVDARPEFIFLSSEPFPFNEEHLAIFKKECPLSKIVLVDGEMFSWYGSRLLLAPEYISKLQNEISR